MSYLSSTAVFKQAPDGLLAHVYEHLTYNYLEAIALKSNLYAVADYCLWGRTYGAMMYIELDHYSEHAAQTFKAAFEGFKKDRIRDEDVQKAARQVAIETGRPLLECTDEFVGALQELHEEAWCDLDDLSALQADIQTSVNTTYTSRGVSLGDVSEESFVERSIHFEVQALEYKDEPAKKALAALIVQALALNIHALLEEHLVFYDRGDEWDASGDAVMYRTTLGFSRDAAPSVEWLDEKIQDCLDILKASELSNRFVRLLAETYGNKDAQYFKISEMNSLTDGIVIGSAGWKSVADAKIIDAILQQVNAGDASYY